MSTFLAPTPGKQFTTRGSTYTADANGLIFNVQIGGYDQADLQNEGCVPLPFVPHAVNRNMLDGGDFSTNPWQRNVNGLWSASGALSTVAGGAGTYFADRWGAIAGTTTTAIVAQTADTSIPGFNQSLSQVGTVPSLR